MQDKLFAPQYERDEHNWVKFPRDVELRRSLWPSDVFDHPAKANVFMVQELALYMTEPGDIVLDPFAGTGTQLISARDGRRVALIELEDTFRDLIKRTVVNWREELPELPDVYLYEGDCRQELQKIQYQVDAAVFSPPYSTTMTNSGIKNEEDTVGTGRYDFESYSRSPMNISRLNSFMYGQALDLVFRRLAARIVPGGRVAVITKDRMNGPRREMLSEPVIKRAQRNGLVFEGEWFKWLAPSTIAKASQTVAKAAGREVFGAVLDEDLILFRKPRE